jgi:hypothetical protein
MPASLLPALSSKASSPHGVLSFLLLERCSSHVIFQLAVVGCEVVRPGTIACLSAIAATKSRMRSSLGSLLRNGHLKKALFSCTHGAEVQHLSEKLRWLLDGQRQQVEELFHMLNIHQRCAVTDGDTALCTGFAGSGTAFTRSAKKILW